MADPRFFSAAGPFTIGQLAEVAGVDLSEGADPATRIRDVAPLSTAGPEHVSFLDNKRYTGEFRKSRAGACVVRPDVAAAPKGMALLTTPEPYVAYARIAALFYPAATDANTVSAAAHVDPGATVGEGCRIDAGAVIGPGAVLGAGCRIGANTVVDKGVVLGAGCLIGPNVTLQYCLLGDRVIVHPGVRIGQDGFGFALGRAGHLKVPQLGRVVVENDVEIGANTTIDRGAGPDTFIGEGTKIDNLVQIAHNVRLGKHCIIVSQVGISGSTEVGHFVMMGGQAGITGHLSIGDGAQVSAQSGVMRDIGAGEKVGGSPSMPMRQWLRSVAVIEGLAGKKSGKKSKE
ncbi:MAG: UDP-3-O-(3-hydroxymyristoyl)glucosamine N-acyltransferase [Rhodospirillales bacterium]